VKRIFERVQLPLVLLAYAGCAIYGLVGTARGSIYPDLLTAFRTSNTEGSIFYSLASATGLIANLTTSRWYPRLGPVRSNTLFMVLTALGTWLIAGAWSFATVLVGSAILGFAMGGSGLLVNVLVAASTAETSLRRRLFAGLHACYGVASFLAPLIVNALASAGCDWRWAFALLGVAPLGAVLVSLRTQVSGSASEWREAFVDSKPWRRTLWYASVCTLYVAVETLLQTRLVQYGRDVLGQSSESANFLLSGFFLAFFVGRFIFTAIPLKHSSTAILTTSGVVSLGFYLVGLMGHPWAFVLTGLGCSVFYPCMMALLTDELGRSTAFAMSWCQTLQSIGCIVMHIAVGALTDLFGLPRAMLFGPVCLIMMIALFLAGSPRENGPQSI